MRAYVEYLKYIFWHKWYVFLACKKWGVPLWRAIIHDWTKFTPAELSPYVHAFYNSDGSKKNTRTDKDTLDTSKISYDFAVAWNNHQKTNKHHWQYWVLINDTDGISPIEIPETYVREMLADWEGAGKAIRGIGNPREWYLKNIDSFMFHPKTRVLVEFLLFAKEIKNSNIVWKHG